MRYFFNFRSCTQYYPDAEGQALADLAAAREEGRLSARELLSLDHGEPDLALEGAVFEITDESGTIVAVTTFKEALLGEQHH